VTNEFDVDVVIVGAGLAGLTAAWELRRSRVRVLVLEARDRVGGRTWTEQGPGNTFIDHGGQYVGPTQTRILALAEEMGVTTFKTYGAEGDRHVSVQGRDDVSQVAIGPAIERFERMAAELPLEAPWTHPRAIEWDAQTVQSWLLAQVPDPLARALLRVIIRAVFTAEPDELSLLHLLTYIRGAGSITLLTQMDGAAQERRFHGGAQTVANRIAARLGTDAVRLGVPVRRIEQARTGALVEAGEITARCRRVIVAVPIPLAERITFAPALPGERAQLHQRISPGVTTKLHWVYPTAFWRADGHSGRALADDGYISVTFDNSCPDSDHGVLVGFVEADAARAFARLPAAERQRVALAEVVRVFGPRAADPIARYEQNWLEEEWTRGCYGGNFGPAGWTRYGAALRAPIGLIHWAGAETSPIWMNYMDGAVRSGERAAAEVLAALD